MNKPIAVVGRFYKELDTALKNTKDGYCVIKAEAGYLVVKESYLYHAEALQAPQSDETA